jgi:CheY-like chemotaxis protein
MGSKVGFWRLILRHRRLRARQHEAKGGAMLATSPRPVVLVVEDEPLILTTAMGMILDAGFEAIQAKNADEAIAILESSDDVRIIFTDINMPGSMNGLELSRAVRGRWPPIRIIVTSGFRLCDDWELPEGSKFLAKPYDGAQLSKALRSLAH